MSELARAAAEFPVADPDSRWTYLNNAGVAPTSRRVLAAVHGLVEDLAVNGILHVDDWEARVTEVRAVCGRLVGADADEIAFVRNTSHGLGLVAEGLPWQAGDEVIVCPEVEYPSNVYVWEHLADRGVRVVPVPARDGGVSVASVEQAVTPRTRLVAASAVQYASGHRTDLASLGRLCRDRELLLCVDGIQITGAFPVDVKSMGVHFWSADSHKWMLGMPGVGFLFVDRNVLPRLRPVLVGWKSTTDAYNFDRVHFELRSDALKLEEGSGAFPLLFGLGACVELLLEVGTERIGSHIQHLLERLDEGLRGIGCDTAPPPAHRAGILTFVPGGADVEGVAAGLAEQGFQLSVRRDRIRVSPHLFNTVADIDRLVAAVTALTAAD